MRSFKWSTKNWFWSKGCKNIKGQSQRFLSFLIFLCSCEYSPVHYYIKRSLEPKRSRIFFDCQLWQSITLQPPELCVWAIKSHLIIQSISIHTQKHKCLAWILMVPFLGQSNLKSLHKRPKSRFNLQGTVPQKWEILHTTMVLIAKTRNFIIAHTLLSQLATLIEFWWLQS